LECLFESPFKRSFKRFFGDSGAFAVPSERHRRSTFGMLRARIACSRSAASASVWYRALFGRSFVSLAHGGEAGKRCYLVARRQSRSLHAWHREVLFCRSEQRARLRDLRNTRRSRQRTPSAQRRLRTIFVRQPWPSGIPPVERVPVLAAARVCDRASASVNPASDSTTETTQCGAEIFFVRIDRSDSIDRTAKTDSYLESSDLP
jgi:hypothetical protein